MSPQVAQIRVGKEHEAGGGTPGSAGSYLWRQAAVALDADDNGTLDGVVLEDQLWAIPADQRPMVMLTQLMVPFANLAKASPDEDLAAVLPRLNPLRPIVTVWNGDRLTGIIPPAALKERLNAAQQW